MQTILLLLLAQLSSEEQRLLRLLEPERTVALMRRLSEEVVDNRSGAGAGSAIAGSEDEKKLADFIEAEMRSLGFEVTREPFPVRRYEYGEVSLAANGERIPAVTLHSSPGSYGTRDGIEYFRGEGGTRVLRGSLVDAGEGLASDYERAGDVRGRVVLVRRTMWPSATALEAAVRGVSAVLFHDYPGENPDEALKQDAIQYHDDVPALAISRAGARRLREELGRGEVEIELESRVDVDYGVSENVIGRIAGREVADEFLAVTAHHDRWHRGAQDDAIGVAVMLELGRVLKEAGTRRSLLLISFGAEEAGGIETQSDWLTGSYAFVKAHPEVTSRLAYAFNVDGAGWTAETGHLFATLDNLPFQRELLADLGLEDRIRLHEGVTNWVDAWSLGAIGGGAVSYLLWFRGHPTYEDPGSYSRFYHTQLDVYRAPDYENLSIDLELGALGLLRTDRAQLLPISLTGIAGFCAKRLEADAARAAGVSFEDALSAAEAFRREAERLEGESHGLQGDAVRTRNRVLLQARHELVPWLLSGSSSGAVLKTTPYARELEKLAEARKAMERRDPEAAASALEGVAGLETARVLSEESYLRERVFGFGPANWGNDFEHDARSVSPEVLGLFRRLREGTVEDQDLDRLQQVKAQSRGHLEEALLLLSGKLREQARFLSTISLH